MKVNNQCIKDVLEFVINNTGVFAEEIKANLKSTDIYQIIEKLEPDYTKEEIVHSILYAHKCGYLDMTPIREVSNIIYSKYNIYDVTPVGYDFLNKNV